MRTTALSRRFGLLVAALAAAYAAALCVGSVSIPWMHVWRGLFRGGTGVPEVEATILWELRLPRVALAATVGAALAAAGAVYQGLFRNPLADPFVIGASGGAALGAVIAMIAGGGAVGAVPAAAFAGTVAAVLLVYGLGGIGPRASPLTLLLAGAALSTILGAMVSLLMVLNDRSLSATFAWLLGGLGGRGWSQVMTAVAYVVPGLAVTVALARPLDALALGEETASSLGVSLGRLRFLVVAAASLLTAASVSVAGVIGFIGLMAPHLARMLVGAAHVRLVPAAALIGALLLILADAAARTWFAPAEVPVGIMTSLMGGPFFLYLLKRRGGLT